MSSERRWKDSTLQVHFRTTIEHLIHKPGIYNILQQIQSLVQHFQAISTWKGLYIACYSRLGVAVLRDFNHHTIQVYVNTHSLSTLTVVYSSRDHESIYAYPPGGSRKDIPWGVERHSSSKWQSLFRWYKITLYPPLIPHASSSYQALISDLAIREGIGSIHIRTNTHTPREVHSSHLYTKDDFSSNFSAKTLLSFPVNLLPHTPVLQHIKQANTKKVTPAQCPPNVAQMMVSWAARLVENGAPQLGILVGKQLRELLLGSSRRLGIQLGGWQWQRLLSIAARAVT